MKRPGREPRIVPGTETQGSLVSGPTISSTVAPTNFTNARSLSFDGTDDYVHVGYIVSAVQNDSITICRTYSLKPGVLQLFRLAPC